MQPITGFPRNKLSVAQVTTVLQNSAIVGISYGADVLDRYLNVLFDLTPYMVEGSTVSHDNYATIHGTCSLAISSDAPLNILTQLVRPWMQLTDPDTGISAKFYEGVYTLTSPEIDYSIEPSVLTYAGYDLLYFLNQPVGDAVEFLTGANPVDSAITLIGQAYPQNPQINEVTTAATLSADAIYPFDGSDESTYLDIINDLLSSCGYAGIYMDWMGTFQLVPYVPPSGQPFEYQFNLSDSNNIIAEQRTSDQDIFDVPNWWRFVMNGITGAPVEGTNQYTFVDNSSRLTSYASRGFLIKSINFVDATDYPTMVATAQTTIMADLSPSETFNETMSPFPLLWHFDQALLLDPNVPGTIRRVQAQSWEHALDGTADTSVIWETVNN